ncbi:MAG: L-aspartate oxidase, partial [Terriglobales bacterium]
MPGPEFIVVGSGIAGLRAAVELSAGLRPGAVAVVTKAGLDDSATAYAQGGIAAALAEDDTVALHEDDTLRAGDGLCEPAAVRALVREAPAAIEELLAWGAAFDARQPAAVAHSLADLAFTREGAHSRSRVLHARGDATGREIAQTLLRRARALPQIEFRPHCIASRLVRDAAGRVRGVECRHVASGAAATLGARAVLLATGGLGQVYAGTTNPAVATGDGIALAAGAWLADMEFVQFHPTALALAGAPCFLLSEALRGEGAVVRNAAGERFLANYDPRAELAPRDVVARAIEFEIERLTRAQPAAAPVCFLDATHLDRGELERRFPHIVATLRGFGLDLPTQPIPIRPAAHYAMGGVATDLDGRSSLPGLFAAGEVAWTGVHGANRLASNSLLEGLVFGARAARAMRDEAAPAGG